MVKEGKKYSEILCAVRNERVTEADAGRVEKATALKDLLGISEDISMEIPCMYLANADDTVRDYLEKRVQVEEGIINSIKESGRNEASERQLALTEKRLKDIKKMAETCSRYM